MKTLALEINDIGLRARDDSGELIDSPGYALINGSIIVGTDARKQARLQPGRVYRNFWSDLSLEALPAKTRNAATVADLAYSHLSQVWLQLSDKADQVIFALPGCYSREQLSLLLGIARECQIPVSGLVDAAVVAAEHPVPGRQLMHLELMLDRVVLTELTQGKRLRRARVSTVDGVGLTQFYDAWANAIGDAFVRNTRYDPMHSAESEQQLYDRLPDWVYEVNNNGRAEPGLSNGNRDLSVVVTDQTLAVAVEPLYRQITRHIAASSRPGEPLTLLLSDRVQAFPGLHDAISDSLPQAEVIELIAGAVGLGALRRQEEIVSGGESVAFVTSVAWKRATQPLSLPVDQPPGRTDLPTHVVYRGRAWPIGRTPLLLGTEVRPQEQSIVLTGDLSGISREHCRILRRDGVVIIEDQSRHGTYVNDRRIESQTEAHYGDLLRLGGSEQVLLLVAVATPATESDGA